LLPACYMYSEMQINKNCGSSKVRNAWIVPSYSISLIFFRCPMLFLSFVLRFFLKLCIWTRGNPNVICCDLLLYSRSGTVFPVLLQKTYSGAGTGTGNGVCRSNCRVCPLLTKPLPISTLFCSYFCLISSVLLVLILFICV
jgi:hypothetical protein